MLLPYLKQKSNCARLDSTCSRDGKDCLESDSEFYWRVLAVSLGGGLRLTRLTKELITPLKENLDAFQQ